MSGIGIIALYAATPPGICPFCGDPIPPKYTKGRKPITCGDPACRTAYFRCYARDLRAGRLTVGMLRLLRPRVAVCNTRPSTVISDQAGV